MMSLRNAIVHEGERVSNAQDQQALYAATRIVNQRVGLQETGSDLRRGVQFFSFSFSPYTMLTVHFLRKSVKPGVRDSSPAANEDLLGNLNQVILGKSSGIAN